MSVFVRVSVCALLWALVCLAQSGSPDPAFEKIPFDQWVNESDTGTFKWKVSVARPQLSFHQRLEAKVEVQMDGRSLEKHRDNGELVFFIQLTDREGLKYQSHGKVELAQLDENIRKADLEYAQYAFVRPGDYRVSVAVLVTKTGDHAARQFQLRVPESTGEELADAWSALPAVEFITADNAPEGWFLPDIHGKIRWAESVDAPVRLNVLMNVAPPVEGRRRQNTTSQLAALLPTLKALSQTGSTSVKGQLELIDLARQRVAFRQPIGQDIEWSRLKDALGDSTPASIDVHSLAERHREGPAFVNEVRRVLRGSSEPCVTVVLSAPVQFESGEQPDPLSGEGLPGCRVFYVRYENRPSPALLGMPRMGGRMGPRPDVMMMRFPPVIDQIAPLLKPIGAKVFEVRTPDEMRRALGEILKAMRAEPSRVNTVSQTYPAAK